MKRLSASSQIVYRKSLIITWYSKDVFVQRGYTEKPTTFLQST